MASNKKENQEENAIEKINADLTSATQKIADNKKVIFWVVGGIAIAAAFVLSYFFIYRNPRVNKAFEAYNQVEISTMGVDSVAAEQYVKVAKDYSGTDAGELANLSAAEAYYNQGKYKQAVSCLEDFSTSEDVLAANAKVLLGDCYVNLKQYDKALSAYNKAISKADGNEQIVPRVLMKEANVYDEQKQYDKALECYETIKKDFATFIPGNGTAIDAYIEREKARLGK